MLILLLCLGCTGVAPGDLDIDEQIVDSSESGGDEGTMDEGTMDEGGEGEGDPSTGSGQGGEGEGEGEFDPSDYTIWVPYTESLGRDDVISYLQAENYNVETAISETELSGTIDADLIVMPGGDTFPLSYGANPAIQTAVRSFVSGGGHYIGICGGAIAGSEALYITLGGFEIRVDEMLGLLDVKGYDNIDWMTEYMGATGAFWPFNTPILFNDHFIASPNENSELTMAYRAGPVLELLTPGDPNIEVIGTFTDDLDESMTNHQIDGMPAVVAGPYGNGRVVLFSTHPEYSSPDYYIQTPPVDEVSYLLINAARWVLE